MIKNKKWIWQQFIQEGGSKLPGGVIVSVHGCSSTCGPAIYWRPVQGVPLPFSQKELGQQIPVTLDRIRRVWIMDGWIIQEFMHNMETVSLTDNWSVCMLTTSHWHASTEHLLWNSSLSFVQLVTWGGPMQPYRVLQRLSLLQLHATYCHSRSIRSHMPLVLTHHAKWCIRLWNIWLKDQTLNTIKIKILVIVGYGFKI